MSNGWTDANHCPPMNVLAITPRGSCFLFAENCEGNNKDVQFTAGVWSKGMEHVALQTNSSASLLITITSYPYNGEILEGQPRKP